MRIVKRVLSTYSADNFGVCSALYELGGLVVIITVTVWAVLGHRSRAAKEA